MKRNIIPIILMLLLKFTQVDAQSASTSDNLIAQPVADRTVSFDVSAQGESKPVEWGLDTAWAWDVNFKRGSLFMGSENVDIARLSFTPWEPLVNDLELTTQQVDDLNWRLSIVDNYANSNTKVMINDDHETVDSWYVGNASRWAQLMDQTTKYIQDAGRTVVSISPFNEPDFGWGQGTITDFYNIAGELRNNPRFDDIRISGGNTLNCDKAFQWYNTLKARLDEGNTHQLAGSFDSFANFYTAVRANGHHATGDEMHNVMEAMVGLEYGMQTGVWWGAAELARGEFCKISHGERLGYAEHRPNWTAASVYRGTDGKIQGFVGGSERQAVTTKYRFVSKDRDVYYDGYGPQREYIMELPGGTGYQQGQTDAERMINISYGEDVQPAINGTYVLVNRNSGKVMEVSGSVTSNGSDVQQNTNVGGSNQQWVVSPVDSRIGGDFSYFKIAPVSNSSMALDNFNNSLWENSGNVVQWSSSDGVGQQWYLDYAEDGWFYIRNRYNTKCLMVTGGSKLDGSSIVQYQKITGGKYQQWRFLPVDAEVEFIAPDIPQGLVASANAESIQLTWTGSTATDVEGYTIFRSESVDGPYNTIARSVATTTFVDNTTATGIEYFYKIRAVDKSLNRSAYSNYSSATTTGAETVLTHLQFEGDLQDHSINLNHGASLGGITYGAGKVGSESIVLNGSDAFIQLPATIANQQTITIATWVYWKGGDAWQRIFDFGNDESENMFLTPVSGSGDMLFSINMGGIEQTLSTTALPTDQWSHVAITMDGSNVNLYVNGVSVDASSSFTISPADFKPVFNYIGRSQWPDPMFNGNMDDFLIYNYALTAEQVYQLTLGNYTAIKNNVLESGLSVWPVPANDMLYVDYYFTNKVSPSSILTIFDMNGRVVLSKDRDNTEKSAIDVSNFPSGIYMLKLTNSNEVYSKKVLIKH